MATEKVNLEKICIFLNAAVDLGGYSVKCSDLERKYSEKIQILKRRGGGRYLSQGHVLEHLVTSWWCCAKG